MAELTVPRGLDGVVVDETRVSLPDKGSDRLYYRGYPIEELAAHASYAEVASLPILPSSARTTGSSIQARATSGPRRGGSSRWTGAQPQHEGRRYEV